MKFKVAVTILILLIVGMFFYSIKLSYDLKNSVIKEKATAMAAERSRDSILFLNGKLEEVMKDLDVFESGAQKERLQQLNRNKFNLGFKVQAKNKEFMELIAYSIGSGFKLEYATQERSYISDPVIYYYSEEGRKAAEELRTDLYVKFPKLARFKVKQGRSSESGNKLTATLRFAN